jgi:hypothetical protein
VYALGAGALLPGAVVVFYGLNVKKDGDKPTVSTIDDAVVQVGGGLETTDRGQALMISSASLLALETDSLQQLNAEFGSRQTYPFDIHNDRATLTCTHLLESMADSRGLGAEELALLQAFWVMIDVPSAGSNVTTKDGRRLWFRTRLTDWSGQTEAFISEQAALELASCSSKSEFEEMVQNGLLRFPTFVNVRLVRAVQDGAARVSLIVVTAMQSALREFPSAATSDIVSMLKYCPASSDCVLVAALPEIQFFAFYNIFVHYGGQENTTPRPARNVIRDIESTTKSILQTIGDGYKVVTRMVLDGLSCSKENALPAEGVAAQPPVYSVIGFCGLDGVMDFKLDPQTGKDKRRAAVVVITGAHGQ